MNQIKSSRAPIIQRNESAFATGLLMISALAAIAKFGIRLAGILSSDAGTPEQL
jgi:hypothetical protein